MVIDATKNTFDDVVKENTLDEALEIQRQIYPEVQGPPDPTSWAPQVIADSSGKWAGNSLRFATKEEAEANVYNLSLRWFLVRETRVIPTQDPVTHAWKDGTLVDLEAGDSHVPAASVRL